MSSAAVSSPGWSTKLVVPMPTPPELPREALPVLGMPSLRPAYESSRYVLSSPRSTTTLRRETRPSPSKAREPGALLMSGSSMMVTSGLETSVPSRSTR
jgi:hypothetical protein